jgi:hypothetical protein
MQRLVETLKLMACSADAQLAAFPDFVVVADEIALAFDDELHAIDLAACAPEVRDRLGAIDRALSAMSGDSSLWTADALRTSGAWQSLRSSAAELVALLG